MMMMMMMMRRRRRRRWWWSWGGRRKSSSSRGKGEKSLSLQESTQLISLNRSSWSEINSPSRMLQVRRNVGGEEVTRKQLPPTSSSSPCSIPTSMPAASPMSS
eukprot:158934-Hanusia_phi.AAC.1